MYKNVQFIKNNDTEIESGGTRLYPKLLGRLRQENHKLKAFPVLQSDFKASLDNSLRPYLKMKTLKKYRIGAQ